MKTNTFIRVRLCMTVCFLLLKNVAVAQLAIETGTTWVSDSSTHTVLDNTGIRYYANPIVLGNTFHFSGTDDVYIESNTQPKFFAISVNTNARQLILDTDIDITRKVIFKTGLFNLHNHTVNLAPAAYVENEQETSRFTDTMESGSISISVNVTQPTGINPGNLGVLFSSKNYSGHLTITRGHQPQIISGSIPNSIARYYTVYTDDVGGIDATLRFNYFDAEKRGLDENAFALWQQNSLGAWKNAGIASRNTMLNYAEQAGFNGFGTFTLALPGIVPPVTELKLSGIWKLNLGILTWMTLSENNNDHFDIERKYPADLDFVKVSAIPSKYPDGNASLPTSYQYIDATANPAVHDIVYRIKQTGKDGRSVYSNSITLNPSSTDQFIIKVYPTIVTGGSIFIQAGNVSAATMLVKIFDVSGKLVLTRSLHYQSQTLLLPLLLHGMYRMVIQSGEWKYRSSFIK